MAETNGAPSASAGLNDADLRGAMTASLRLLVLLAVIVAAVFWWKAGWQSGVLALVGAAISGASLWEWQRLVTVMNQHMDAGRSVKPTGSVLAGFGLRLCLTLLVLYGSIRYLHGTVLALAAGLALGVIALSVQAVRLLRR